MFKKENRLSFLPCLVCGIDSGPVLKFFIWLIGGALIASVLILSWALSQGKLQKKDLAMKPIEIEGDVHD